MNKKVLITGADGFIGSHLVESLLDEDYDVKAFVYYNSFNSWGWLDTLSKDRQKNINIFAGDIRDSAGVREAVKGNGLVFHLAALIGIPFSYHSPESYVDTNIKGTLNVLQACRDYNVERVILTSTSEVYGTAQFVPINEKHPLQPQSPYSATKIGADSIADSFYRSFDLPLTIARPFNTYGPRQSARAIIPTVITQLLNGNKQIKIGSINTTRDLNYVLDTCKGFMALANCDAAIGSVVNIGSGKEISIGELARLLIDMINPNAKIISEDIRKRPDKSEVERLLCDNNLIKDLTGWKPEVSLKAGLRKTIEWFSNKDNLSAYKHDIYNI
jgi:NAD dependent epimerase/dehydratase